MRNRAFYQGLFLSAGIYNIGWGIYAVCDPQWLFKLTGMPLMHHPQIFACLGMVVGLYGLIYLEVARKPEAGFVLALVGLIGKLLGPAGWVGLYLNGTWPWETVVLILTNDLIWWIPFTLYLREVLPFFKHNFNQKY